MIAYCFLVKEPDVRLSSSSLTGFSSIFGGFSLVWDTFVSLGYKYYEETEYQNYAKAIQWLQKVLEPENSDDLRSVDWTNEKEILEAIAFMYRYGGYGVVKNQSEALKWESRAKELSKQRRKSDNGSNNEDTKIL